MRGGLLTQDRLGELIGVQMGDAGYTGAAVSEWERDKSKIHADDRLVLISLSTVLVLCGGLDSSEQADGLLAAGNYRRLDAGERALVFQGLAAAAEGEPAAEQNHPVGLAAAAAPPAGGLPSRQPEQLILLEKVCSFWVEGVLQKSLQGVQQIAIPQTYSTDEIDHPWSDHLGMQLIADVGVEPSSSIYETFCGADSALLVLGYPGSGKTTTLITLAQEMVEQAQADCTKPVPVILDLASWSRTPQNLAEWAVEELTAKYQMPRRYGRKWITANELVLLLDGLDTLPLPSRRSCIEAINAFRESHGLTGIVVCSRTSEYGEAEQKLNLNTAIVLHPLSDDQLAVWKEAGGYQRSEWDDFKVELAGSMETFSNLEEAAGTMGRYYVHDA